MEQIQLIIGSSNSTLQFSPSDIVADLDREAQILKELHKKISDQLSRLQVEEVVIRKQLDTMKTAKVSDNPVEVVSETNNPPSFQLEFGNLTLELLNKDKNKTSEQNIEEEEEEVDLDDEASASMRQILANELGSAYSNMENQDSNHDIE